MTVLLSQSEGDPRHVLLRHVVRRPALAGSARRRPRRRDRRASARDRSPRCCWPTSAPTSSASTDRGGNALQVGAAREGHPRPRSARRSPSTSRIRAGVERRARPGRARRHPDRGLPARRHGAARPRPRRRASPATRARLRTDDRLGPGRPARADAPATTSTTSRSPARSDPIGRAGGPPQVPLNLARRLRRRLDVPRHRRAGRAHPRARDRARARSSTPPSPTAPRTCSSMIDRRMQQVGAWNDAPRHQPARHRRPVLRRVRDVRRPVDVASAPSSRSSTPQMVKRLGLDDLPDRNDLAPWAELRETLAAAVRRAAPRRSGPRCSTAPTRASRPSCPMREALRAPPQRRPRHVRRARRASSSRHPRPASPRRPRPWTYPARGRRAPAPREALDRVGHRRRRRTSSPTASPSRHRPTDTKDHHEAQHLRRRPRVVPRHRPHVLREGDRAAPRRSGRRTRIVPRDVWTKAGEHGPARLHDARGVRRRRRHGLPLQRDPRPRRSPASAPAASASSSRPTSCRATCCRYATEEQKARWFPKFCSGEMITAIAMTEPGTGSDLQGIKTTAVRDGDEYVVNGSEDVHHQRHQRRLRHRRRARPIPTAGAMGCLADRRRARHGGLRARPQPRQDRPQGAGHRRAVLRRRARAEGRTCSARRATASST